jgi:hypothetical protein
MLKPLSAYQAGPYRPRRVAIAALLLTAFLYVGSMPLHWVGVVTATGSYVLALGATAVLIAATVVVWRDDAA